MEPEISAKKPLSKLEIMRGEAFIRLMSAMLSNPAIIGKEENVSVRGQSVLSLMRQYAIETIGFIFPDSEEYYIP